MQGPQRLFSERKPSLTRSQTDSNITYMSDEMPEAPGSACYITKEGDLDIQVVLKVITNCKRTFLFMHRLGHSHSLLSRQYMPLLCGIILVVHHEFARLS